MRARNKINPSASQISPISAGPLGDSGPYTEPGIGRLLPGKFFVILTKKVGNVFVRFVHVRSLENSGFCWFRFELRLCPSLPSPPCPP